ncbi:MULTISPECIES: LysE family translocator [unclassified Achromobacter]|uniref:LysE family translocator n=1 Tax=unclassified Achromobacter TaxID=2626865 RepID=UPI000B51B787|nr:MULTISPECIES: LysE family translocator [unclassified Achromobacter]OWT75013.1 lysine transporter LysE [Achromobacter sp. HZ28]OWT76622.1 lysine transporter LysE [Achromobacter sp. HZ34]
MSLEQALFFGLTCLGFGFIPGPALLQTVSLTLQHGRRAGFLSALGIHLGAFFQICIVALGAVAVLKTAPMLYHSLKVLSGAYLVWLGVQRIRAPVGQDAAIGVPSNVVSSSALIEASNPKSALFYFSFLLQFTNPDASLGVGWQLFLLGACANLLFTTADVFCILLAHPLRARVSPSGKALRISQFVAGMLFVALGVIAIVSD